MKTSTKRIIVIETAINFREKLLVSIPHQTFKNSIKILKEECATSLKNPVFQTISFYFFLKTQILKSLRNGSL
jgi:hypothetical protein